MTRLARVIVAAHTHHVTPRGNGRVCTFFGDLDYAFYREARHPLPRGQGRWSVGPLVPDAPIGRPLGPRSKVRQRAFAGIFKEIRIDALGLGKF
jgi:hypothetical protein